MHSLSLYMTADGRPDTCPSVVAFFVRQIQPARPTQPILAHSDRRCARSNPQFARCQLRGSAYSRRDLWSSWRLFLCARSVTYASLAEGFPPPFTGIGRRSVAWSAAFFARLIVAAFSAFARVEPSWASRALSENPDCRAPESTPPRRGFLLRPAGLLIPPEGDVGFSCYGGRLA